MLIPLDISPDGMSQKKDFILKNPHIYFKILNQCKKEVFEQTIMNLFEFEILKFFDGISNLKTVESFEKENNTQYKNHFPDYYNSVLDCIEYKEKEPNITKIIFNLSFKIFKQCVDDLDEIVNNNIDNNKNQNQNLYKLYTISYIKLFLSKFVYFNYTKNKLIENTREITDLIKGSLINNKFRKVLKIYVFKLYFNLMKGD